AVGAFGVARPGLRLGRVTLGVAFAGVFRDVLGGVFRVAGVVGPGVDVRLGVRRGGGVLVGLDRRVGRRVVGVARRVFRRVLLRVVRGVGRRVGAGVGARVGRGRAAVVTAGGQGGKGEGQAQRGRASQHHRGDSETGGRGASGR